MRLLIPSILNSIICSCTLHVFACLINLTKKCQFKAHFISSNKESYVTYFNKISSYLFIQLLLNHFLVSLKKFLIEFHD